MTIKTFSTLITEKKDHIINKLPLLTPEQKREVIDFFTRKPNLERKIDWNKGLKLAWEDFVDVMREVSKTERKKAVKQHGIAGLKEGEDYIELHFKEHYDENNYQAYIPLHWEASKLIASAKIGNCEGAWCIAYQKDISYWKSYTQKKKQLPIFVIGDHAKWSVMVHDNDRDFDVWDHYVVQQDDDDIPGLDIYKQVIKPNAHLFDKLRQEHFTYKHFIEGAQIRNAKYRIDDEGFIHWESGEWISGEWDDGEWLSGKWERGVWGKGEWHDGEFHAGQWKEGHWHTGHWLFGVWEDGLWENGTWHDGQWKDGTWYDGTWIKGLWLNGTWKKGTWEGGLWQSGAHIEGEWNNGKWNQGMWMDGYWRYGEWNGGVWLKGTWNQGMWNGGEWHDGMWEDGDWKDGDWLGGYWNDGWWEKGTWHGGKWRRGTWNGGTWLGGEWLGGYWNDGWWEKGTWHGGKWRRGTWNGGTWLGGEWLGGYWNGGHDSKGVWHEQYDSPDKWIS